MDGKCDQPGQHLVESVSHSARSYENGMGVGAAASTTMKVDIGLSSHPTTTADGVRLVHARLFLLRRGSAVNVSFFPTDEEDLNNR